jgi:hypothetical protein
VGCVPGLCWPGATPPAPFGVVELVLEGEGGAVGCGYPFELDGVDGPWLVTAGTLLPLAVEGVPGLCPFSPLLPLLLDGVVPIVKGEVIGPGMDGVVRSENPLGLGLPLLPGDVQLGSVDPGVQLLLLVGALGLGLGPLPIPDAVQLGSIDPGVQMLLLVGALPGLV